MNVKISNKQGVYSAFCIDLVEIIEAESYLKRQYGNGECSDNNSAEYALDEFNYMLRDIIGWYRYEVKKMPEILCNVDSFVLQFDKVSYNSFFYDHPDIERHYNDELAAVNTKKKKKDKIDSEKYKDLFFSGHDKLTGDILKQDLSSANPDNPFYDKRIVFTGVMNAISRNDAAARAKKMGADINTSISKITDIVIVGMNAGPSKLKKIEEYNNAGANIRIIEESEFLELIKV